MQNNNIFCPDPSNQKEQHNLGYNDIEEEDFNDEYEPQIQTVIKEATMLSNIMKEHLNIDIDDEEEEKEHIDMELYKNIMKEHFNIDTKDEDFYNEDNEDIIQEKIHTVITELEMLT